MHLSRLGGSVCGASIPDFSISDRTSTPNERTESHGLSVPGGLLLFKLAWLRITGCGHVSAATDASSCGVRLCYSQQLDRSAFFEGRAFPGLLAQSNPTNAARSELMRRQPNACPVRLNGIAIWGGSEKEPGRC